METSSERQGLVFDADRVKRIRLALGFTQREFANFIGKSQNIVSRWETGLVVPTTGPSVSALMLAERKAGLA